GDTGERLSVLRVLKVVSAASTLNVTCPEPVWLKCLWRDSASGPDGPVVRTTTEVSPATWPEPSASEQPSDIILMAMTWAEGAVEQPTITERTRLSPDSLQPIICL